MRLAFAAVLLACLMTATASGASFGAIASESGIAVLGNVLGVGAWLGATFLVTADDSAGHFSWEAIPVTVVGLAAVPALTAGGAVLGGRLAWQDGRFLPAYLGSLVGVPVGYLVLAGGQAVGTATNLEAVSAGMAIAGLLMPTVGAVVGFNLGRPEQVYGCGSLPERLRTPGLSVGFERLPDGRRAARLDARLVSIGI